MTNAKTTKRALFSSMVALLLCFTMLLGTTYAWFTDSVVSSANKIIAGNLDVDVLYDTDDDDNVPGTTIQDVDKLFSDVTLWEPGVVAYENLTVVNKGNLALTYALSINYSNENYLNINGTNYGLSDVLKFAIVPENVTFTERADLLNYIANSTLDTDTTNDIEWQSLSALEDEGAIGQLYPVGTENKDSQKNYAIVVYWEPTDNDNNYNVNNGKTVSDYHVTDNPVNQLKIDLGVSLVATQYTYEEDSFDDQYDKDAAMGSGMGSATSKGNESAIHIHVHDLNGRKVGAMLIYDESIEEITEPVNVQYSKKSEDTDTNGITTYVVDITASNFETNKADTRTYIRIPAGLDGNTVSLYKDAVLVDKVYDYKSGYVIFNTQELGTFTIVYDSTSEHKESATDESKLPKASVTQNPELQNVSLEWRKFQGLYPDLTVDPNPMLEAVYTFECTETEEQVAENPFKDWYCDFYVKLDRNLGANQILLGGNYGNYGWVGFHNGDITLDANTEIGLLSAFGGNLTYEGVYNFVKVFKCGVGDVNNQLAGATFTVTLRITNPKNEDQSFDIETVTYKFPEITTASDVIAE